jgi:hypothetical protein
MMRPARLPFVALATLLLAAPAAAADRPKPAAKPTEHAEAEPSTDGPAESGFSLGARAGYALPMGSLAKDTSMRGATDLSRTVSGMLPLWVDAGYRVNRHFYLGAYFQFAPAFTANDLCNRTAGNGDCSSSGTDLRFGGFAKYTFSPDAKVAPWIGVGVGYEILDASLTAGANTYESSAKGFEYASLHLGGDYHVLPELTVGPTISLSFAQYSSYSATGPGLSDSGDYKSTALHEWFTIGLRGQFDL